MLLPTTHFQLDQKKQQSSDVGPLEQASAKNHQ
jgi:hypothetical protein